MTNEISTKIIVLNIIIDYVGISGKNVIFVTLAVNVSFKKI